MFISCKSSKTLDFEKKSFIYQAKISKIFENDKSYIFVTNNNDIIESTKLSTTNLKCTKIEIGNDLKFEVIPVSEMFNEGRKLDREFDVNDSLSISYRELYFAKVVKKYCWK